MVEKNFQNKNFESKPYGFVSCWNKEKNVNQISQRDCFGPCTIDWDAPDQLIIPQNELPWH